MILKTTIKQVPIFLTPKIKKTLITTSNLLVWHSQCVAFHLFIAKIRGKTRGNFPLKFNFSKEISFQVVQLKNFNSSHR